MYQTEDLTPIYFKIPKDMKSDFDFVCKKMRTPKTHKLFTFIKEFLNEVEETDPKLFKQLEDQRQRPSKWSISSLKLKKDPLEDIRRGNW